MALVGRKLPDDTMPQQPGDYSYFHNIPRPDKRKGVADEWFVIEPGGTMGALIPECHTWSLVDDKLSITPSILFERGTRYHGYLTEGVWS